MWIATAFVILAMLFVPLGFVTFLTVRTREQGTKLLLAGEVTVIGAASVLISGLTRTNDVDGGSGRVPLTREGKNDTVWIVSQSPPIGRINAIVSRSNVPFWR